MEAKAQKWWPRGENLQILLVFAFLNEGGEFLGGEKLPLPHFYVSRCRGARPGELTCIFFFGRHKYALSTGQRSLTRTPFRVD